MKRYKHLVTKKQTFENGNTRANMERLTEQTRERTVILNHHKKCKGIMFIVQVKSIN